MRSGQIQHAINHGVAPFALCHIVSGHIRTSHKRGDHIQDSIGAVFHTLPQRTAMFQRNSSRPFAKVPSAAEQAAMEVMLAEAMEASVANALESILDGEKKSSMGEAAELDALDVLEVSEVA